MFTGFVRLNIGQHVAGAQRITQSRTTGDAFGTAQLGRLQRLQGGRPQITGSIQIL
jgi:hypothetical protein